MGILQASSTQTDWGVGCWILCFLVFALEMWEERGDRGQGSDFGELSRGGDRDEEDPLARSRAERIIGWVTCGCAGLALCLALLSKGTAILYCAPLGIWLACGIYRRFRWRG